jgi:hypothetical protein
MDENSLEKLLSYIPRLESGSLAEAQAVYLSTGDYLPELVELEQDLKAAKFHLESFDWLAWADEARPYLQEPARIEEADADTVRKLMTLAANAGRFNKSLLPHLCVSGFLVHLLVRVRALLA